MPGTRHRRNRFPRKQRGHPVAIRQRKVQRSRLQWTVVEEIVPAGKVNQPAYPGLSRLAKQAEWLEREYPSAAASLREGLAEMFTVSRLGLSPSLSRCLVSTNVI
jgi:hypothetical protein